MSEENEIFKSQFEGIFPFSQSQDLLMEYKFLIQKLNQLSEYYQLEDFELNKDIIKLIFGNFDETIKCCKVNNGLDFFTIILNFKYKEIDRYKKIEIKKTEYKFFYKNVIYNCFTIDSMREYLDNLSKELVFYIEIENTPYGKIKIKDIE